MLVDVNCSGHQEVSIELLWHSSPGPAKPTKRHTSVLVDLTGREI